MQIMKKEQSRLSDVRYLQRRNKQENNMEQEVQHFSQAFAFFLGGILFFMGGFAVSNLLSPIKPNPLKNTAYECGEPPTGSAWGQFNVRFYVMGLIFLIFDVEILLLFPWALALHAPALLAYFPNWQMLASIDALVSIGILLVGHAYVWTNGDLDWIKPKPHLPTVTTKIPMSVYAEFNNQRS